MPSADFCKAVTVNLFTVSRSFDTLQTSRGKTLDFRCVDAEFIKRSPLADGRLRGHVPTRLSYVTPHIQFLSVAPQLCVELPSDPASRQRPCPSANLRLRDNLVSGLSPDESSAMPGTHAVLTGAQLAARPRERSERC